LVLPKDADIENVKTDFQGGVLNVTFDKKEGVTLKRKLQIL
jgi:HSP20 family molecular chaperone IbpA